MALSGSLPFLRTSICTMGRLSLQAQQSKRQGEWPHLTPRIHKGQCALAQAVPHHEGLPRLACPRVPGLLPAIPSLGPSLEGQRMRSEETQGPTSCSVMYSPDPACYRLRETEGHLKIGLSADTCPPNCEGPGYQSSDSKTGCSLLDGPLVLGLFA